MYGNWKKGEKTTKLFAMQKKEEITGLNIEKLLIVIEKYGR